MKPGVTADEIDRVIHEATIARDAYPSTLNYNGYKKSCCISVNEVICHGIPDQRPLQEGDIVNLDVSLFKDGFHTDLNETKAVGKVDDTSLRLIKTTRECLEKAIATGKLNILLLFSLSLFFGLRLSGNNTFLSDLWACSQAWRALSRSGQCDRGPCQERRVLGGEVVPGPWDPPPLPLRAQFSSLRPKQGNWGDEGWACVYD